MLQLALTLFLCGLLALPAIGSAVETKPLRSLSLPFLEQPAGLNGNYPGEVGFDPLGLFVCFPYVSSEFSVARYPSLMVTLLP